MFASNCRFLFPTAFTGLTDILASIAAMVALMALLRFWEPKHLETHDAEVDAAMKAATDDLQTRARDAAERHYARGRSGLRGCRMRC